MSYVALYRTYRPKKFSEVYGQKVIVQTLQNALENEKFAHAYIFSGPRGTGKTSVAKIVAKTLNCRKAPTREADGDCDICQSIDKGHFTDIIEIDAASNNGVDEIRDLRDKIKYAPSMGKYKVYIIDEVHMLTTAAFNALLKTLEEPPKFVVFILATTEIHKLPSTILSRCQRFDFKNIDILDIEENLHKIIKKENLKITDEAVKAVAVTAEGGMRDALSLLDQVVSFTNDEITDEDVYKVSGGLSRRFINDLLLTIHEHQPQKTLELINQVLKDGKDINRMVADLIIALRDLLLDKINKETKYPKLKEIKTQYIYAYLDILNELQQELKYTTSKRAYLELAMIKLVNHESIEQVALKDEVEALKQQIKQLESDVKTKIENIKTSAPVSRQIDTTKNQRTLVSIKEVEEILNNGNAAKRELLNSNWFRLRDYDVSHLNAVASLLAEGSLEAMTDDKMLLVYDDIITAKTMLRPENKKRVLEILNRKTKQIKDYIVVLKSDWILIKDEYVKQFRAGIEKPTLSNRDLHLYEEVETIKKNKVSEDPLVAFAQEAFGEKLVKVEE